MTLPIGVKPPGQRWSWSRSGDTGFTLIELLAVVVILLALLALLLPTLDTMRERAITTSCLSNLRQLHIARMVHAQDRTDWPDRPIHVPYNYDAGGIYGVNNYWGGSLYVINLYKPYVSDQTWYDPQPYARYNSSSGYRYSYGISCIWGQGGWPGKTVSSIRDPARTADMSCKIPFGAPNLFVTSSGPYSPLCINYSSITTDPRANDILPWPMHGGWFAPGIKKDTNISHVDGSARTYPTSEIMPRMNWSTWSYASIYGPSVPPGQEKAPRNYLWSGVPGDGWLFD